MRSGPALGPPQRRRHRRARGCQRARLVPRPGIVYPNPIEATNLEPLLINTAGSWEDRPEATTAIENLFLASDYVRTHTDLATMEGANEAARRAVNGILERSGSNQPRCPVWRLRSWPSWRRRERSIARCSPPPAPRAVDPGQGGRPDPQVRADLARV